MITANDVEVRRKAVPFEPFRIVMSSGSSYDIYHPDMLWSTRRTIYVGMYTPGRSGLPEQAALLSVLHISEIQSLPATVTP